MKLSMKKYYLGHPYQNVYFTHRQAQCMIYFLKGYPIRHISAVLKLSPRTIEAHTNAMKAKLNCASKTELIEKVHQTSFLNYELDLLEAIK